MRVFMETGFYLVYLVLILTAGVVIIRNCKDKNLRFVGEGCLILGIGDAFHLVPRAVGLITGILQNPSAALNAWLGAGKLITSITMTFFYLMLMAYLNYRGGTSASPRRTIAVWVLVLIRIFLCGFPQNQWLTNDSPLLWGILRNIPFTLLGLLTILVAFRQERHRKPFRFLWLAVTLSFLFYLPVVLWASAASWVGMLMLPKTLCYLWIAGMGVRASRMTLRELSGTSAPEE